MSIDLKAAEDVLRPDEATALVAWRALVEADAEQVPRISERSLGGDHYRPITRRFAPNPRPSPELAILEALARPEDTWRDIGAGGGRLAIPLARLVRRVHAVEPSESQRGTLREAMDGQPGDVVIDERRWPIEDEASVEPVDVSLSAHAVYDTADLAAYLDAMERTTRRLCVVVLNDHARGWHWRDIFEAVHGERQAMLPALTEFVAVLSARGRRFDVQTVEAEPSARSTSRPRSRWADSSCGWPKARGRTRPCGVSCSRGSGGRTGSSMRRPREVTSAS